MLQLIRTNIGRLKLIGYAEGISLLLLLVVAVPMKYIANDPAMVKAIGPVHGALFLLYVFNTLSVGVEHKWKFSQTTWKLLLACMIPFGTFYIDRYILERNMIESDLK
jgi:integral membrane protein